jgi:hypothetical protein
MAGARTRSRKTQTGSRSGGASDDAAPAGDTGLLGRIKQVPKLAAAIGAVVATIAAILGLADRLWPKEERAPTDASLSVIDFRKHVSLEEYLRENNRPRSGYNRQQLARDGVVVTVKAEDVSGVKSADLYYRLRDSVSGEDVKRELAGRFKIKTNGDSGGAPFFVPAPDEPGKYLVVFELLAPNGTFLSTVKTETFSVA